MLLFLAQAAAEPAPAGWERGADFVVKHAEQRPDVLFPLLASIGFLAIIVGAGYAVVKFAIPAWRAEKAADREHLTALVVQRGREAQEDVAAARALAEAQHKALRETIGDRVERVTGEIARLVDRSERHGDLLSKVAAKIGLGLLVLILAGLGIMEGQRYVAKLSDAPITCDPPCPSGQRCTRDGCKEIKTGTASASKSPPHSALRVRGFANLASGSCLQERTFCP